MCLFCLFVSQSVSIYIPLRFRFFGQRFSPRTIDVSRESQVVPPTRNRMRSCWSRKLNAQKLILMILSEKKNMKIWRWKYPVIWYVTVWTNFFFSTCSPYKHTTCISYLTGLGARLLVSPWKNSFLLSDEVLNMSCWFPSSWTSCVM